MTDVLDRLSELGERLRPWDDGRPRPFDTVIDEVIGPAEVRIGGRRTALLGANNYLGLSFHPAVVGAAREAIACGTGTTGSRVANGTTAAHAALEDAFAQAFGRRHAMVFTTGHQANLSVVAGLCGPGDAVVLDSEAHASLVDGARLSGADLFLFRHDDAADLDRRLARLEGRAVLVGVEGIYSISGDAAWLPPIAEVCRRRGARLLVDEAHSFGVCGQRGLGMAEAQGIVPDIVVGTFSKALGGVGGFAVADHDAFRVLHFVARSYLFTSSGTPQAIAAARAALALATDPVDGPRLREALWTRVERLRDHFEAAGLQVTRGRGPIVSIQIGDAARAVEAWRRALEAGVYVNVVLPPGCRRGEERLRCSVSAAHPLDLVDAAAAVVITAVEGACRSSS